MDAEPGPVGEDGVLLPRAVLAEWKRAVRVAELRLCAPVALSVRDRRNAAAELHRVLCALGEALAVPRSDPPGDGALKAAQKSLGTVARTLDVSLGHLGTPQGARLVRSARRSAHSASCAAGEALHGTAPRKRPPVEPPGGEDGDGMP